MGFISISGYSSVTADFLLRLRVPITEPDGISEKTGLFFDTQSVPSLCAAIKSFEENQHIFIPADCRTNAEKFSTQRFEREFSEFVEAKWAEFSASKRINY